jgi:predicted pyridoxine 5'-phosphate oxidase superfamily flavin-nucleotide-binding protein
VGNVSFNSDEIAAQRLAGASPGTAFIRRFMPAQHREFFSRLPYLFVGVTDTRGWPVATILTGQPGFAHSADPATLRIDALPDPRDPAAPGFAGRSQVGVLGIDLANRRRNRVNGRIETRDATSVGITVGQSFGNCPRYIQRRDVRRVAPMPGETEHLTALDDEARETIRRADTFFVASVARKELSDGRGADISHRGGRPGFVHVAGDTLVVPDFRGNRFFNTLGNLLGEPRAGLLFVDFERGDLLQLQGATEIDWGGDAARHVQGAERSWRFRVAGGWRRRAALPLRWTFVDFSPATEGTGV